MTFSVVWLGEQRVWCWDQATVDDILTRLGGEHRLGFEQLPDGTDGAVVVVPARYYTDRVDWLNDRLAALDWVVVILTSDEESTFAWDKLTHPNMRLWVMTPRPGLHDDVPGRRFLPHGLPPDTTRLLGAHSSPDRLRGRDWSFAGQVNHARRAACARALRGVPNGDLRPSPGFTQGLPRGDYLALLANSKVAPCPSGPATPDSFRLWEALEAGCMPIVDGECLAYGAGYWSLFADDMPIPGVSDWKILPSMIAEQVAQWPGNANRAWAWWQTWKRDTRRRVADDIDELAGTRLAAFPYSAAVDPGGPDALVTVLVPTSPIPAHPSTHIIDETVASVRYWLPDAEIVVLLDGCREEMDHRRADYDEYTHRVLWHCAHDWGNATPIVFDTQQHQANTARRALGLVRTPLVAYVEHDAPLVTDEHIDWSAVCGALTADQLDVVRFHFESVIPRPWEYLMLDKKPRKFADLPALRTVQWSGRPHVARTDYYQRIITEHFPTSGNTLIEVPMHGVCQNEPWKRNRLAVYAPPGSSLKRSLHLDGRADDPEFESIRERP